MRLGAACALLLVGAFAATVAVLLPTYVSDRLARTPLDIRTTTVAETPPGLGGDVLDTASIAGPGPLTVSTGVPLSVRRAITVEEPSDADRVTFQGASQVRRGDRPEETSLLTASVDRVTLDRRSGLPVEPAGTLQTSADAPAQPVPRTGLQQRFPFGTEKRTYSVYDATSQTSFPAEFVEETVVDGVTVYHFRSVIERYDLRRTTTSPINTVTLPAAKWGLGGDEPVTMTRWYSNTREIYVEPRSGSLVGGAEQPYQYFARDAARPEVTVLKASFALTEAGRVEQLSRARDAAQKLELLGRAPVIAGVVAVVALSGGTVLAVSSARGRGDASVRTAPSG